MQSKKTSILFLTLKLFSATGGIEKVCRVAGKAFEELGYDLQVLSMYDQTDDAAGNRYFNPEVFRGFGKGKGGFALVALIAARQKDIVVLSHINLLPIGWILKLRYPSVKLVLFAHGIEVWDRMPEYKRRMLNACNEIWAVSQFTKNKLITVQGLREDKIQVLNNCLDPYLQPAAQETEIEQWKTKFGIARSSKVLLTLTRLASTERHKGYDRIIKMLPSISTQFPGLKYIIAGKYTSEEFGFIRALAETCGVANQVILPGFIKDDDMSAIFGMADLYVMPSKKEGFGIVFIEAMNYGLPVIAGNWDGSVDAVLNGKLGTLVDPGDDVGIKKKIVEILANNTTFKPDPFLLMEAFSFKSYLHLLKGMVQVLIKKTNKSTVENC